MYPVLCVVRHCVSLHGCRSILPLFTGECRDNHRWWCLWIHIFSSLLALRHSWRKHLIPLVEGWWFYQIIIALSFDYIWLDSDGTKDLKKYLKFKKNIFNCSFLIFVISIGMVDQWNCPISNSYLANQWSCSDLQ